MTINIHDENDDELSRMNEWTNDDEWGDESACRLSIVTGAVLATTHSNYSAPATGWKTLGDLDILKTLGSEAEWVMLAWNDDSPDFSRRTSTHLDSLTTRIHFHRRRRRGHAELRGHGFTRSGHWRKRHLESSKNSATSAADNKNVKKRSISVWNAPCTQLLPGVANVVWMCS